MCLRIVAQNARMRGCVGVRVCVCVQAQYKQQRERQSVMFMKQDVHSLAIFVQPFNSRDKKNRLRTKDKKANQLSCASARDLFME